MPMLLEMPFSIDMKRDSRSQFHLNAVEKHFSAKFGDFLPHNITPKLRKFFVQLRNKLKDIHSKYGDYIYMENELISLQLFKTDTDNINVYAVSVRPCAMGLGLWSKIVYALCMCVIQNNLKGIQFVECDYYINQYVRHLQSQNLGKPVFHKCRGVNWKIGRKAIQEHIEMFREKASKRYPLYSDLVHPIEQEMQKLSHKILDQVQSRTPVDDADVRRLTAMIQKTQKVTLACLELKWNHIIDFHVEQQYDE